MQIHETVSVEIESGVFLEVLGTRSARENLLPLLPDWGLAVVGSREPDPIATLEVRKRLQEIRGSRLIVISGLARGIDQEAHRTALDLGLPTIAVIGCGVDRCYPSSAVDLRNKILHSGGLVLSPFLAGTPPAKFRFILRNEWIAKLSAAVWVVQARAGSGALSTAQFALDHSKTLFVTPAFPGDIRFQGNESLLRSGTALPYFSDRDLGSVWLEFAARKSENLPLFQKLFESSLSKPSQKILSEILERQNTENRVSLNSLIHTSQSWGWTQDEFFLTWKELKEKKQIVERSGLVYVV